MRGRSNAVGRRYRVSGLLVLAAFAAAVVCGALSLPALAVEGDAPYESRVVGGTAASNGTYPFVASLQYDRSGTSAREDHFCGGTLIDADSVLTAAHCVDSVSVRRLRIVVGATVLDSRQGQARRVAGGSSGISIHPRYDADTRRYDAAVIELDRDVRGIRPISLAAPSQNGLERPGRRALVAGWGTTDRQTPGTTGGEVQNRLRVARVPLVSDAACDDAYSPFYPGQMVCAGREGVDTCQGDSGGPMFATVSGKQRQIGVTSFGAGCAAKRFPGVYTEVNERYVYRFITQAAGR